LLRAGRLVESIETTPFCSNLTYLSSSLNLSLVLVLERSTDWVNLMVPLSVSSVKFSTLAGSGMLVKSVVWLPFCLNFSGTLTSLIVSVFVVSVVVVFF
jgi:hypothetical protein